MTSICIMHVYEYKNTEPYKIQLVDKKISELKYLHKPPKMDGITFKLDPIDDSNYGIAENLSGTLQFVLPPGEYAFPKILKEPTRLRRVILDLASKCRDLWPDLLDEEVYDKMKDYCLGTALLNPSDLEQPRMQSIVLFCTLGYCIDDLFDQLNMSGSGQKKEDTQSSNLFEYKEFGEIWQQVATKCDYHLLWDKFPSAHASIESFKQFGHLAVDVARNCVPDYDRKSFQESGHAQETLNSFMATIAVEDAQRNGQHFSTTTMFELYRYISAVRLALELSAIFHDIYIKPSIREDILFQSAVNNYSDITTFYNSILGLPRDVRLRQEDGPIMFLVAVKKYALQEAFDEVYERLQGAYNDYKMNTSKLCEVYAEDENVIRFCKLMGNIIDGTLYGYKTFKRYGVRNKLDIPGFTLEDYSL